MRARLRVAVLLATLLFAIPFHSMPSLAAEVSVGAHLGAGHVPLSEWDGFFGSVENSDYSNARLGLYADILGRLALGRHSLRVSVGAVSTSARSSFVSVYIPPPGSATFVVDWDFLGVPIGVGYEVALRPKSNVTVPYVGAAASLYYGRVTSEFRTLYPPDLAALFPPTHGRRTGWGYGFHGFVGQRASIMSALSLVTTLRATWADGMAFTDSPGSVAVQFTGIDFTVGAEWGF